MKQVIRVTKEEFELDDGSIFPIVPPLKEEMTTVEFQEHYERACNLIDSFQNAWYHKPNDS